MIGKNNVELYINGKLLELGDDSIRLNNTLFDPTKLTATTSTYSYTFDIPKTRNNNKILGNINTLSRRGKFNNRYYAKLYSSNVMLFEGYLMISDITDETYSCNLYIPKNYSLNDVFGEDTMNMIEWRIPFNGVSTINAVNGDITSKYFFPYVAYSLPIKSPYEVTGSGYRRYTDKKTLDEYTYFYFNSFVPSLNLVELMKKAFEYKGLTLEGNFISDPLMNEIYLSNYIADGQDPMYNYGNPLLGDVKINVKFGNSYFKDNAFNIEYDNATIYNLDSEKKAVGCSLNWDYMYAYNMLDTNSLKGIEGKQWRLLDGTTQDKPLKVSYNSNAAKLLCDGGIQIPCDGWYEITLSGKCGVDNLEGDTATTYNSFNDIEYVKIVPDKTTKSREEYEKKSLKYDLYNFPIEFQLLRYNAEDSQDTINHNPLWTGRFPNEENTNRDIQYVNNYDVAPYIYEPTTALMDVWNNPNYLCGFSRNNLGLNVGYIKDGSSWNTESGESNEALYNNKGYLKRIVTRPTENKRVITYEETDLYKNNLSGYTTYSDIKAEGRKIVGVAKMIVKLEKNNIIIPFLQSKGLPKWESKDGEIVTYAIAADMDIRIRAVATNEYIKNDLSYGMASKFDELLNLGNFLNSNEKISDWINNVMKTLNLSYEKNNDIVTMNFNKINQDGHISNPINIDDRCNSSQEGNSNVESEMIEYPSYIENQFSINTDEEGFYRSVPFDKQIKNDWTNYGERGSDRISVFNFDEAKPLTQTVGFSYDWQNEFQLLDFNEMMQGREVYEPIQVSIIGKYEDWIETDVDYDKHLSKDGRSLKQRMWFRGLQDNMFPLPTNTSYMSEDKNSLEWVYLTLTSKRKYVNGVWYYLNFNNNYNTLMRYFHTDLDPNKDSISVELYITPMEYKDILQGSLIQYDDDIYRVLRLEGFDPKGLEKTKLRLLPY